MEVIRDPQHLQKVLIEHKRRGRTVGFVPTMGALHLGHLSLLTTSIAQNDVTVLSIFVNPTQFNNPTDFEKYPRSLDGDLKTVSSLKVDYIFAPDDKALYTDNYNYSVVEKEKNKVLCGRTRPGHFEGVLTVVLKLLQITVADRMYLGEKDYQQLEIIRGMAEAFFLPVEIIGCSTLRDSEGLALSSRNQRLSAQGLGRAREFAKILKTAATPEEARSLLAQQKIEVDYLEELWGRRFGAVFIDDVRLIDNVPL